MVLSSESIKMPAKDQGFSEDQIEDFKEVFLSKQAGKQA